jgi:dihydrodipicolinate synthase/N-acetylneuraminate lyase
MDFAATRNGLYENIVAVPTTIWKETGELDFEANAANAEFLFEGGVTAAVYAGGVGEHDRLSIEQHKALLGAVGAVARGSGASVCLGSGLGRTAERVRQLAPALAEAGVSWAMLMPPAIDDQEEQFSYYSEVIGALREHGVWAVLYARPEHPMSVGLFQRLFDAFEIPGVKLAHNGMLLTYAEMVSRLGHERSAWLCGTAGWWMPSYHSVNAARGMSSGIVNAFPQQPRNLLKQVLDGGFEPDADYWTMVRIEQIRQREKANLALVIKHMQEVVGLKGGMNGDGAELSGDVKVEVENLLREGGWVA